MCGGWGRGLAPREARLQLARRPLMTGVASSHAFLAASASLNVTCGVACMQQAGCGSETLRTSRGRGNQEEGRGVEEGD